MFRSRLVDPDTVSGLALQVASDSESLLQVVDRVTDWVYRNIRYRRGATDVTTTADQVAVSMEGVCQDKTHLTLGMLRSLGVPCRYVSGLLTGQTGETHSWLEFLHPQEGWVERGYTLPSSVAFILPVGAIQPVASALVSPASTGCLTLAALPLRY